MLTILNYLLCHSGGFSNCKRQEGATLIEYVLIVGVIAIGIFVGVAAGLDTAITNLFETASNEITNAPDS